MAAILENISLCFCYNFTMVCPILREILYEDAKSANNDDSMPKISKINNNSKWRTDLNRNVTKTDAAISC